MLFTLIDDRDAWMKFFEYFDLVQKIEDATHTNIERLANALSIKFYNISNRGLSCELYEEGDAGGGVQFTIDGIICEARFYATGSEELDDSFVEYFIPINNTESFRSCSVTYSNDRVIESLKSLNTEMIRSSNGTSFVSS